MQHYLLQMILDFKQFPGFELVQNCNNVMKKYSPTIIIKILNQREEKVTMMRKVCHTSKFPKISP